MTITTHAIWGSKTKVLHAILSVLDWHAVSICVAVHDDRCMGVYLGIERRDATLAPPLRGTVFPVEKFDNLHGIRNFANKAKWITAIAQQIKTDSAIPLSMDKLTELPGIGRKSASVILRGAGAPAEGIIVDIHVIRVAPRLGITKETDPKKIELDLMKQLPPTEWDAGMAMSFLGREICRPKPLCEKCLMNKVCLYYSKLPKHPKR